MSGGGRGGGLSAVSVLPQLYIIHHINTILDTSSPPLKEGSCEEQAEGKEEIINEDRLDAERSIKQGKAPEHYQQRSQSGGSRMGGVVLWTPLNPFKFAGNSLGP